MIRAAFMLVVPLVSTQVAAAEVAIKCRSESTTFAASPGSPPSVKSEPVPDQTFIMDEEKQLVWRWLAPLNKRDPMCNDPSCIKTFTTSKVDLFWQPKAGILQWQWGFQLDRLNGHGVWYWQFSRANEMQHVRVDMMCLPTAVPVPIKAAGAL